MNNRRTFWAIGLLLAFLLFYSWLPVGFYSQAPIFFSVFGAVLCLFFLIQLVGDFRSWEEFNTKDKSEHDWRHKVAPAMVLPAIAILAVFLMKLSTNETKELKKYGVTTKGTIIDGSGFKSRRGGMYDLTIEFKDENDRLLTVKKDVGEDEFNRYGKGEQVMLVYSKKHPNILRILSSDESIEEYTGIKARDLEIKDLKALLTMKRTDVDSFLNTISYGWQKHDSGWVNERKYQYIRMAQKGTIVYVGPFDNFHRFPKLFKQENFQEVQSKDNPSLKLFYNDSLDVAVEMKTGGSGNLLAKRLLSIVSMRLREVPLAEKREPATLKKH